MSNDDWLSIDEEVAVSRNKAVRVRRKKKRSPVLIERRVTSSAGIPREAARKFGEGRVWGCDGSHVFFRPKRMIDGVMTQVANPAAMERHERFLRLGHYKYIETSDDVQIYKVLPSSPFARTGSEIDFYAAETGVVQRVVITAACKRDWKLYTDALTELAVRIKGADPGPLGANMWKEALTYIDIQIAMRGGPTVVECGAQLQNIRIARGEGRGRVILLPQART